MKSNYTRLLIVIAMLALVFCAIPVQAAPKFLANYSQNLTLLLHQDTFPFVDERGQTINDVNNVTLNTTSFVFGGGSGYYYPAGSYLSILDSGGTNFTYGTKDFTIMMWINPQPLVSNGFLFSSGTGSAGGNLYGIWVSPTTFDVPMNGGGNLLVNTSNPVSNNTWHQFVLKRASGRYFLFIDGNPWSSSIDGGFSATDSGIVVGGTANNPAKYDFIGGIDEVAVWKGIALPNGTFWPQYWEVGQDMSPLASFTSKNVSAAYNITPGWAGVSPFTMIFNDTSTGAPSSWKYAARNLTPGNMTWIPIGTNKNQSFSFPIGNWDVNLTALNIYGSNISTQQNVRINVTATIPTPIANFTTNISSGQPPLAVSFTDTSTASGDSPIISWDWEFGDGSVYIGQTPPAHTYVAAGTYIANLTVMNTIGVTSTKLETISAVSRLQWVYTNGHWIATDGTYGYAMWNTTIEQDWVAPYDAIAEYLIVGGGGSGALGVDAFAGGGGGSGGINIGTVDIIGGDTYTIHVGSGSEGINVANSAGVNGDWSWISGIGIFKVGAGGAGGGINNGLQGGSGGGGSGAGVGGWGFQNYYYTGDGNNGGNGGGVNFNGGGGGGAGAAGYPAGWEYYVAGNGGNAKYYYILPGEPLLLGGGGGGGAYIQDTAPYGVPGVGGSGIGGNGVSSKNGASATDGKPATGSGGGGASRAAQFLQVHSGAGGSGLVILKYKAASPTASFDQNVTYGNAPLAVSFTDTSSGTPISWVWTRSNLTHSNEEIFSTLQNPAQSFNVGNWSINLTASNMAGSNISAQISWVNASPSVVADFTASNITGYRPLPVLFTDTSTGYAATVNDWNWTFGDGAQSTSQFPPVHVYTNAGIYTANLTVRDTVRGLSSTKLENISVISDVNVYSNLLFKSDIDLLQNITPYNRTVQITNITGATYVRGTTLFDPLQVSIKNVYLNTTDINTLSLTSSNVDNSAGTVTFNITTNAGILEDIITPESILDIQMFYYNYTLQQKTSPAWGSGYLGNGSSIGPETPVSILTDVPLTYSWKTFSNFAVNNTTPAISETVVKFTPIDTNQTANRWLWNFGDGTTFISSNITGATHIYEGSPATYNVSLTAYLDQNPSVTNTTTKNNLITTHWGTSYINADFSGNPVSGTPGVAVAFTDHSVYSSTTGLVYNWSFGDPQYSSSPYSDTIGDVTHVYPGAGTYTVNLTITNIFGSSSEEKLNYIIVATNQDVTNLVYQAQQYRLIFQNLAGTPLGGLSVTATPLNFTMPANWTSDLIGISPSVNINNNVMSGITATDGSLGMPMLTSLGYRINVSGTAYSGDIVDYSITAYPPSQGTDILLSLPTSVTHLIPITPVPTGITYNIYNQTVSNTTQILSVNFNDPFCVTNLTIVNIVNQSGYVLNTTTYTGATACNVVNNFTYIEGVTSPSGDLLSYGLSAYVSTAGGWNNITENYDSNKGSSLTGDPVYDQWVAIILIVVVSSAFTASSVYLGTIAVGLMGLGFYTTTKWFTPGVPGSVFITMCVFWICIGVIGMIAKKGRGGF
jgi:PKD repeat protein